MNLSRTMEEMLEIAARLSKNAAVYLVILGILLRQTMITGMTTNIQSLIMFRPEKT